MDLTQMISDTGVPDWILMILFVVSLSIQCMFYTGTYLKLVLHKPQKRKGTRKGVTVIICARNEARNLEIFLPRILEQDYPEFEVVVVNDSSSDGTEQVLSELAVTHKNLRYTTIPPNEKSTHGKKLALTLGMKSAKYDHVLLTDADCYPASDRWLKRMVSHLVQEKEIVLGYGGYEKRKGLLNMLIRYETVFTAIQYFSFALKGKPYMGVGRNLSYKKALFFRNRGFAAHYHIASGDDDLFVNEHAGPENTAIEIHPEGHTISIPRSTLGGWIRQKQRHLSAGSHYNTGSRRRIGTEMISRLMMYTSLVVLCFISPWWLPIVMIFGLFQALRMTIFKLGMTRLNEKYLLLPSLLFDPVLPIILGLIWFSNVFVTKYQPWN